MDRFRLFQKWYHSKSEEQDGAIFGSFGVPMTSVPAAAYFENFLGPWKPVKASDGEYYTLGSGRLP